MLEKVGLEKWFKGLTRLNMLFSPTLPQLENAVQQTEQPAKQYDQQHAT